MHVLVRQANPIGSGTAVRRYGVPVPSPVDLNLAKFRYFEMTERTARTKFRSTYRSTRSTHVVHVVRVLY